MKKVQNIATVIEDKENIIVKDNKVVNIVFHMEQSRKEKANKADWNLSKSFKRKECKSLKWKLLEIAENNSSREQRIKESFSWKSFKKCHEKSEFPKNEFSKKESWSLTKVREKRKGLEERKTSRSKRPEIDEWTSRRSEAQTS